jgi:hypothetical protein
MAISAVSSVSSGPESLIRLYRARGSERSAAPRDAGPVRRVQATPELLGREDVDRQAVPLDPRHPRSILVRDPSVDREARSRLDELLGQKSAIELRQALSKGEQSAEVVSQLAQLKARDSAVRSHEAAHIAAGGSYITGGASYTYQKGPDGAEYAVGGEVGIDTSPIPGRPEETAQKMRTVRAAALAPSDPSAADLAVAGEAAEAEAAAMAEIAQARSEDLVSRYSREAGARPKPLDMIA